MKFKGNSRQIETLFIMLIQLYGVDAKVIDIQKSVLQVRREYGKYEY